ncbi:hypothetical protein E1162_03520 [Rhodobacteraceae bacterium RKSG542]|uniref:hypothetical protein n=1 Tax=Pseudovibrio flavus TaxID=2529854 RepID=UPI0012BBB0E3|nr:hypothetical protein [Pseudovibrio flavus]MTI16307.1 hypothetical protein [Pseudovibrio flavus]
MPGFSPQIADLNDPIPLGKETIESIEVPARLLVAANTLVWVGPIPDLQILTDFQKKSGAFVLSLDTGKPSPHHANEWAREFFDGTHAVELPVRSRYHDNWSTFEIGDIVATLPFPLFMRLNSIEDMSSHLSSIVPYLGKFCGLTLPRAWEAIAPGLQEDLALHFTPIRFQAAACANAKAGGTTLVAHRFIEPIETDAGNGFPIN